MDIFAAVERIELEANAATNLQVHAKQFSDKKRKSLAKKGKAEKDGSFPIENKQDLENAKHAFGRSKNKAKTKAWINKRAKQLGAPKMGASISAGGSEGATFMVSNAAK